MMTTRNASSKFLGFAVATLTAFGVSLVNSTSVEAAIAPGPFGAKSTLLNSTPLPATAPKAQTSFSCGDVRRSALSMSAHASNLANRQTTRTAEGGPYKKMEIVCKAGTFCNVETTEAIRMEYQPGHPDADPQGYVKYPSIDAASETAGLNTAAAELKLQASQAACGAKIIEQGSLAVLKYNPDFEVMMDTITFGADGNVLRWSRTTRDGKTQNLSFKADGTTAGL